MHLLLPAAKRRWKSRTVRMVRWLELATRPIRPGFWYTLLLMATFYAVFTLTRPDGPVSPPEVKVSSEPAPGGQAEPLNATPVMRGDSLAGALEEETRGPAGLSDNPEPSREWRHLVLALLLATALAGYGVLTRPEIRVKDSDEFLAALKVWAEYIAGGNGSPRAVKKFLNRLRFHAMRMRMHGGAPGRLDRFSEWLEGWRRGGSSPRAGAADGGSGTAAPGASADAARQPVIPDAVLVALAAIEERRPEDLQELLAPDGGEPGPTEKLLRDKLAETAAELGDTPAARSLKALLEPATAPAAGAEDGQPPRDSIEEMLAAGCREYMKISRPTYRATGGAGTRGVLPLAPIAAGDGAAARDDGIARV